MGDAELRAIRARLDLRRCEVGAPTAAWWAETAGDLDTALDDLVAWRSIGREVATGTLSLDAIYQARRLLGVADAWLTGRGGGAASVGED